MTFKTGINLTGVKPEMVLAAIVVDSCYRRLGEECVVTSCTEGQHGRASLHYVGQAMDFRTNMLTETQKTRLLSTVTATLGSQFDAALEPTHMHVEYQPK
jgi:uncharacterized protein YcbK (DUF882 family)